MRSKKANKIKNILYHFLVIMCRYCFKTVSLTIVSSLHYAMIFVIPLRIINACKTMDPAKLSSDQCTLESSV